MLREVCPADGPALRDLLASADSRRYGIEPPATESAVAIWLERARERRSAGLAWTHAITLVGSDLLVGVIQVRQLDPTFETAEWESTVCERVRGTGVFQEAARLVGSMAFGIVGVRRLEARVPMQNGRAQGAFRKLGAIEEGVLRRSIHRNGAYEDQVLWSLLKDDWRHGYDLVGPRVH